MLPISRDIQLKDCDLLSFNIFLIYLSEGLILYKQNTTTSKVLNFDNSESSRGRLTIIISKMLLMLWNYLWQQRVSFDLDFDEA